MGINEIIGKAGEIRGSCKVLTDRLDSTFELHQLGVDRARKAQAAAIAAARELGYSGFVKVQLSGDAKARPAYVLI